MRPLSQLNDKESTRLGRESSSVRKDKGQLPKNGRHRRGIRKELVGKEKRAIRGKEEQSGLFSTNKILVFWASATWRKRAPDYFNGKGRAMYAKMQERGEFDVEKKQGKHMKSLKKKTSGK